VSTAAQRAKQLDLVARLKSAYPELPDAPSPDLLDHDRFTAYMKPVHDVGGEPDTPMKYENKGYEYWEHMTYVMCEVLAWRGIWLSEERRRMGNVDVGRAVYLGFPYSGRWLLSVARVLLEKHHIGLTELTERMAEVRQRYAGGLAGKKLAAEPKCVGDGSQVERNRHIVNGQIGLNSLFDFRIDPTGRPVFLEASLYCSFAPSSVLAVMAAAGGIALDDLLATAVTGALKRR